MRMPPSETNRSAQLTREQCDAELRAIVEAVRAGDYAAAEHTALALHEAAKRAQLTLIANRAATVYAAVCVRAGTAPLLSQSMTSLAEAIERTNFAPTADSP